MSKVLPSLATVSELQLLSWTSEYFSFKCVSHSSLVALLGLVVIAAWPEIWEWAHCLPSLLWFHQSAPNQTRDQFFLMLGALWQALLAILNWDCAVNCAVVLMMELPFGLLAITLLPLINILLFFSEKKHLSGHLLFDDVKTKSLFSELKMRETSLLVMEQKLVLRFFWQFRVKNGNKM